MTLKRLSSLMVLSVTLIWGNAAHAFTSDAVRCVQQQLNSANFDAGEPDGLIGRKSRAALAAYQSEVGTFSQRPLTKDHALVFCRLIGMADPALKAYWPDKAGKAEIVFGQLDTPTKTMDKLFAARMRNAIKTANLRVANLLGISLAAPVKVLVANSPKDAIALKQKHEPRKIVGFTNTANAICTSFRSLSGTSLPSALIICRKGDAVIGRQIDETWMEFLLAHEIVHTYQWQLAGAVKSTSDKAVLDHSGPQWLLEGSAQAIANHLSTGQSLAEYSEINAAKFDGPLPRLVDVDDLSDLAARKSEVYRMGVIAIAKLIPDEDYSKLGAFYEELGRVGDWPAAFKTIFGITAKNFYKQIDAL